MFRITTVPGNGAAMTLKLEGELAAEWVEELEAACRAALAHTPRLELDLWDVTSVDRRGVRLLRGLPSERLKIARCPALLRELLDAGR